MRCPKGTTVTSLEDLLQGEDRHQRRALRWLQSFLTAQCKSHLFGQAVGRRERAELGIVILGFAWVRDEGCDDDCCLWGGSSSKRKASTDPWGPPLVPVAAMS